jgi:hypothetical protein
LNAINSREIPLNMFQFFVVTLTIQAL